jgi:hypothetical protein
MKVAFVTFANGTYVPVQDKLVQSIQTYTTYDIVRINTFEMIGSPTHTESPYEFKLHSILYAKNRGYDVVIWCDSPVRVVRSIDTWISQIEKHGVYIQQDGWSVGQWANDKTLSYFGVSRDEAMKIPNAYACILAFDFRNEIAIKFLEKWFECARNGLFRGRWNNNERTESNDPRCLGHRHDQSCVELIAYKLGIEKQGHVIGDQSSATRYFTTWNNP